MATDSCWSNSPLQASAPTAGVPLAARRLSGRRYTASATRSRSAIVRISYAPRDEMELAGTEGDFEALWAELRGARTTNSRDRQRLRLMPRGNAHSSPPWWTLLRCRSTRGFQRPRELFHKSNR